MDSDSPQTSPATTGRGLKTASHGLQALRLLGLAPEGLSVEELAIRLDKSKATARYLLNTLCQQGFARRDTTGAFQLAPAPPWGQTWGAPAASSSVPLPDDLTEAVSDLYQRTRQRTYLACQDGERTVIVDSRGHQGLACIPGLGERIAPDEAHALAITKTLASASPEFEEVLRHEMLPSFTGNTISESRELGAELAQVRQNGFAIDREEYAEAFCCIAAPIRNPAGEVTASLGLSLPPTRFAANYVRLVNEVVEVAAMASEQWREEARQPGDDLSPSEHGGAMPYPSQ